MCGTYTTTNKKPASRLLLSAVAGVTVAFAGLYASPARAQGGIVLDEVIVTAQKREQTLQDVPASVSAISGDTVREYLGSAENIRALAGRVPSLNIESSNGRVAPRFYIRGLGNIDFDVNANQPVGMVYDDISLENNVLRSLPLFDIERVEVLKGPQGSLFGRNSNAGIIKIDSVRPSDEPNAYASFSYGDRDTVGAEFATNVQASDSVSMRASFKYLRRSDWIDNVVNGIGDDFGGFDEYAWRLQFLIDPNDTFTGLFKLHGFSQDGSQPQVFYANSLEVGSAGLRPGFDEKIASHDGSANCIAAGIPACAGHELDHYGLSANLVWDLEEFTFTSITGYDTVDNFQSTDVDGGLISFDDPADVGALGRQMFFGVATGDGLVDHYQWTQEFRIAADTENTFFQVGLFMFEEDYDVLNRDFGFFAFEDIVSQETSSFAIFGQADWALTDRFSVVAGLRFTYDDKKLVVKPGVGSSSPAASIAINDDYISWDLAFTYDVSDDWSIYGRLASASRGPVTLGRFGFTSSAETETSDSVELGFKANLMGGRARWNAAIYSFRNDDQQLTATGGVGNVNQLLNADRVNGEGFETDFEILFTDNLLFIANASYNDTEIDDPDLRDDLCGSNPQCTPLDPIVGMRVGPFGPVTEVSIDGNPLPRTPDWVYNLILQWTIPVGDGEAYIHTDWNYRAESNLFLHESVEFVAEERWIGGLRIGYRSDNGVDFALVGRNVTNEVVVDGGINFLNLTTFINEPSYWGVEMRKDW
jgi:iron complex outermembrane receptor protein